ncbi:uncharacterized protein LOC107402789 [Peromyscus maniculatus bairdii]|uniref:uncharacterized protein LOC107402789 n=1 Tax=Peromyscus maniculatus bairdii TaxID=230844 RepID=UPI003FD5601F
MNRRNALTSPAPFSSPADTPTWVVTATSEASPTSHYVIRTPGPPTPFAFSAPRLPRGVSGLPFSVPQRPRLPSPPRSRTNPLRRPVLRDPGPRRHPDRSAVPSGLVKDTASSPHTPPAAAPRPPAVPPRAGHSPQRDRTLDADRRTHRGQCTVPPALSSFIATDPPDSRNAGRRQGGGGTAAAAANHGPRSRSAAPAPRPAFCQWEGKERRRLAGVFPRGWEGGGRGGDKVGGPGKWGERVT